MNAPEEARALREFLELRGFKPSGRAITETLRRMGLKFRDTEIRDAAGTQPGRKIRAHGTQSGRNRDASTREGADHKGVSNSVSLVSQNRKTTTPLPLLAETIVAKPRKGTVAAQDPDTDFGVFEPDVVAMIAVEIAGHPRRAPDPAVIRQRLALLWRKHGDAAFARGLDVGVGSGKGLNYGRAVMERYDPDRDSLQARGFDGELNESDRLPTRLELEESGQIPVLPERELQPWELPPWKRFPEKYAAPA
jgi:hypothetical protein